MQQQLYRVMVRSQTRAKKLTWDEVERLSRLGDVVSVKAIGQKQPVGNAAANPGLVGLVARYARRGGAPCSRSKR